ncbi:T9SS type A sorting domain-containing protein [Puteibacter caeruleilacunae]|nr:T9SS type A sorting domain-containing protein [Puteibacter caeruleilacunae]
MAVRIVFLVFLILTGCVTYAQDATYLLFLTDKQHNDATIDEPKDFLSERAIDRRLKFDIPIDSTDLPVSGFYIDSLKNLGLDIWVTSRWLNTVTVKSNDQQLIDTIEQISFIDSVVMTKPAAVLKSGSSKFETSVSVIDSLELKSHYGNAFDQVILHGGEVFHELGMNGKGIHVAILDAGFYKTDQYEAFDSLFVNHQILGTRDFVSNDVQVYDDHPHGMAVLSIMASYLPNQLVAPSTAASYWLLRSEEDGVEYPVEEDYWIAATEFADSAGVDIINSSLGYFLFDEDFMNHSHEDMNGESTRITQAANMAFKKGILVVASAGNEGNKTWKHIIAPADGNNVLAVGAIDVNGDRAEFSSTGIYPDNVKPNVMAVGKGIAGLNSMGQVSSINGTSFSAPLISAFAACLMEAYPGKSCSDIKMMIEELANQYNSPDSLMGFGIPDFKRVKELLAEVKVQHTTDLNIGPNPFSNELSISFAKPASDVRIEILDILSRVVYKKYCDEVQEVALYDLNSLKEGVYLLMVSTNTFSEIHKIVKY